jgi:hypothetical protein
MREKHRSMDKRLNPKLVATCVVFLLIGLAQARVFFENDVYFEGDDVDIIIETEQQASWLAQIWQILQDIFVDFTKEDGSCHFIVDDNVTFSRIDINKHTYYTEYTYDQYLATGTYYWKARCQRNGIWSAWSDTKSFTHIEGNDIYFDWTIIS